MGAGAMVEYPCPSSLLKNVVSEAVVWQMWPKKRLGWHAGLTAINEHIGAKFNAATASKIDFRQSAGAVNITSIVFAGGQNFLWQGDISPRDSGSV